MVEVLLLLLFLSPDNGGGYLKETLVVGSIAGGGGVVGRGGGEGRPFCLFGAEDGGMGCVARFCWNSSRIEAPPWNTLLCLVRGWAVSSRPSKRALSSDTKLDMISFPLCACICSMCIGVLKLKDVFFNILSVLGK